ncbi:MAG TPA: nicotinate (nicotinamide) nucleotide adenylyltransferase [Cytophagales bacterium]|jgi:nicotinate-nucleotide adenylyltransferase|nr:nicotinate (nicotinamide) nucleotide adenylyltransferase [Cytophagales bacterium]
MNIGLFFGTFNPIHNGHTHISKEVLNSKRVNEIWLIVSPQTLFKKSSIILDKNIRINMVNNAVKNLKNIYSSSIEFELEKPNYTVNTLNFLSSNYSENNFKIIIGEDNLESFDTWKDSDFIKKKYELIVYPRRKKEISKELFDGELIKISSTDIRKKIKNKESINNLVPENVEKEILKNGYYS